MDKLFKHYSNVGIIILCLFLNACSTVGHRHRYPSGGDHAPNFHIDVNSIPNATPKAERRSKYGNPATYCVLGHRYHVMKSAKGYDQTGIASWYGMKFDKQRTSSGEPYDVAAMTAASKVLPLPTYVRVTNLENKREVIVKVNDRGPFHENRVIDLSYVAASKLGMLPKGTALVEVKAIDPSQPEEMATLVVEPGIPQACAPLESLGHPKIYLQMGAFRNESNAIRLQGKVKECTTYPVLIKKADKNGAPIYRVQIGPIPDVDNTDNLHARLESAGLGEPITVIQ